MIQSEFRRLVGEAVISCKTRLGERFLAAYLHGSIEKGDAVAGVSDLDLFIVASRVNMDADEIWLKELCGMLQEKYAEIDEAHITLMDESDLARDRFSRFALVYNAALLQGKDIAALLNEMDDEQYLPDKRLAKMRLGFARRCFRDALEAQKDFVAAKRILYAQINRFFHRCSPSFYSS